MASAVIVDAVRTAGGKRNGKLSGWHPADLAAEVLNALPAGPDLVVAIAGIEDVESLADLEQRAGVPLRPAR